MNAVDAMPGGGSLTLTASGGIVPDYAVITISDTGAGIPKEIIPYVFEPFFTTKPPGMGTGLGLSVAKRIISDHGGEISIKSKEGKGTTVTIKLPLFSEERTS
jgi:signal transduction histidine kinase